MPSTTGNPTPSTQSFNPLTNPYPAKKPWPPSVLEMDRTHQFRLERRYRRRAQRAYLRPGWDRSIKLVQFASIAAVIVYSVGWMEWGQWGRKGEDVTGEIRKWAGLGTNVRKIDEDVARERIERALAGQRASGRGLGDGNGTGKGQGNG